MAEQVTVALKHPHGIVMQLYRMVESEETTMGGSRTIKRAERVGEPITLNGYLTKGAKTPLVSADGEFAYTSVPKDFWDTWIVQNKDLELVKRGLVFAHVSEKVAADKAKERHDLKSGLEPLDPSNLPKGKVVSGERVAA